MMPDDNSNVKQQEQAEGREQKLQATERAFAQALW